MRGCRLHSNVATPLPDFSTRDTQNAISSAVLLQPIAILSHPSVFFSQCNQDPNPPQHTRIQPILNPHSTPSYFHTRPFPPLLILWPHASISATCYSALLVSKSGTRLVRMRKMNFAYGSIQFSMIYIHVHPYSSSMRNVVAWFNWAE